MELTFIIEKHNDEFCSICLDNTCSSYALECQHKFCPGCLEKWLQRKNTCPICRANILPNVEEDPYSDIDNHQTIPTHNNDLNTPDLYIYAMNYNILR